MEEISGSKKVMIIDDDEEFREGLKEFLEFHGWEVDDQHEAQEAIRKLKVTMNLPDLILLDYLMPLENGISFWNALNDDRDLCHLPTIMMTAHEMNSINVVGVRAMVKKPIDTDALLTLMNTLRNEQRLHLTSQTLM
jgi:DNA-binding response OmpR family regulator